MFNTKCLKVLLFASWLVLSLVYYTMYRSIYFEPENTLNKYILQKHFYNDNVTEPFLIDTPGCYIPNYSKTIQIIEAMPVHKNTCGQRAVFIRKISNDAIKFTIDEKKIKSYTGGKNYSCCYQFAGPYKNSQGTEDYTKLSYSACKTFENNTKTQLEMEVITVTCVLASGNKRHVIYEDAYMILKKLNDKRKRTSSWNVLILGMDTMSRARVYKSMRSTVKYFKQHNWLDYRGYQKVGYNTFPNVLALLSGKKMSTVYKACTDGMDKCNNLLIWSDFKKSGYITATGEDYLRLPDTFSKYGYKNSPTDHYLRPLFLTGEHVTGNLVCTKKTPSAKHILDYAFNFADNYKNEAFFGMFWFNSYSHNLDNIPTLLDDEMVNFFKSLNSTGVLNNTFVLFLSDHGIRYGKTRVQYESYYEERLPMLFLWVPLEFQKKYGKKYRNMQINENRLTTPYDLYLSLWEILANGNKTKMQNSEACPNCTSIFNEISPYRKCSEVNVDEKWCTCHKMFRVSTPDEGVKRSIELAVSNLQNKIRTLKTTSCKECEVLQLKTVLRTHTYQDESENKTYFVIAFVMAPGDVAYEATVVRHKENFTIIGPTNTISTYNTRGNCVLNQNDRAYCVCKKNNKCKM